MTVLLNQIKAINKRDKTIANIHSITTARCGLLFAGSDKLSEKDFLPFNDNFENDRKNPKKCISKSTALIFMEGVNSGELPSKVIAAFTPHINEICRLVE